MLQDFRVAGDALRVVKISIPDHVMSSWSEKFGFEKPLKYDRKDFAEDTQVDKILAQFSCDCSFFSIGILLNCA